MEQNIVKTPEEVLEIINNYCDPEFISRINKEIKGYLDDNHWLIEFKRGTEEKPYWRINFPSTIRNGEKKYLIKLFKEAGWPSVIIQNSEEKGEPVGMSSITFGLSDPD